MIVAGRRFRVTRIGTLLRLSRAGIEGPRASDLDPEQPPAADRQRPAQSAVLRGLPVDASTALTCLDLLPMTASDTSDRPRRVVTPCSVRRRETGFVTAAGRAACDRRCRLALPCRL
ncbi:MULTISPECIES: DUF5954 family protein [unclassified Micromonospora]|uniref:DUF5954 family protein n=1 Tax=unclassified Micromonospora TaxID=2617518 RepID=UPI00259CB51F|nr:MULTISPECIES: DUF5954 family protein [unclassified Micromonospora]MDM4783422.1 DUF5954 family protein [Micromonospora sp. b486]